MIWRTLPYVSIVTLNFGSPEIVITFNARDRGDVVKIIDEQLARVKGVERIETLRCARHPQVRIMVRQPGAP